MSYRNSIAFIGGGNMAEALAAGISRNGILPPESIIVSEPSGDRRTYLATEYGFQTTDRNTDAAAAGGTVFLSVKPHEFFQRDGADLFCRVPISMTRFVNGRRMMIVLAALNPGMAPTTKPSRIDGMITPCPKPKIMTATPRTT